MENKENANRFLRNEVDSTFENTFVSPKILNSCAVLKQIMPGANCNSLNDTAGGDPESAAVKSRVMSLTQTFLQKTNTKKQIKPDVPNSVPHISEKHILGSYRGKIVSSKVNSFWKLPTNEARKNSPSDLFKSRVKTGSTTNSTSTRDAKFTSSTGAPKLLNSTPFQARTVRVSVYHPKTILNHEKQSLAGVSENNGAAHRNRNWKPLLKTVPANANNSVQRTKTLAPSRTVTGSLKAPVSESHATMSASKSIDNNKVPKTSADVRRAQLAEWQASKGVKKLPHSIPVNSQPKTATCQQTIKEPVESFWATIVEEDEQGLFSDRVNKTLAECLHLIEKGCVGETVHSTLEKLIATVPDAKKFAKYWVCQMRLEQFCSMEKVIGIYEKAILAGAQPKDELRHTFVDVVKARRDPPKSDEKCVKEENTVNHEGTVAETETEEAFKEVTLNNEVEYSNEASQESTEVCSKTKQGFSKKKKNRNKEQKQKPIDLKNEQAGTNTEKDGILEIETPENEKSSYLIKYNLSTTSHLESTKKKLQCDDSTIKDLKFLTPVRRSCRIHEKANKLPSMLKDHSPCVSSLEQLGELGDEVTGFIYRPNNALQTVSLCQHEQN
ncbi:cytoskeleton-associated protein 2 [Python bivittatus]|uniref:Cytoskeleton-associated protein 2 n=1 Tax=Python bivittatus TaxID=176946 RepID=A0A9F3QUD6_PYTBI|nr:cytoskeleton-associated protein 2 [Python bivittatus]